MALKNSTKTDINNEAYALTCPAAMHVGTPTRPPPKYKITYVLFLKLSLIFLYYCNWNQNITFKEYKILVTFTNKQFHLNGLTGVIILIIRNTRPSYESKFVTCPLLASWPPFVSSQVRYTVCINRPLIELSFSELSQISRFSVT